jgi:hypothetical protein
MRVRLARELNYHAQKSYVQSTASGLLLLREGSLARKKNWCIDLLIAFGVCVANDWRSAARTQGAQRPRAAVRQRGFGGRAEG